MLRKKLTEEDHSPDSNDEHFPGGGYCGRNGIKSPRITRDVALSGTQHVEGFLSKAFGNACDCAEIPSAGGKWRKTVSQRAPRRTP